MIVIVKLTILVFIILSKILLKLYYHQFKKIDSHVSFEISRNTLKYIVSVDCFSKGIFNIKINDSTNRYIVINNLK